MVAVVVHGMPAGLGRGTWRRAVADAAAGTPVADGVSLAFTLPAARWVDLDTLAESTLAGLRDAGAWRRGYAGLDAVVATRGDGHDPGVVIRTAAAATLQRRRPPGRIALDATGARLARSGDRDAKRAWRAQVAAAWGDRPPLAGPVWADLQLRVDGSVVGPLEPALDALEPVLGRDPRGRRWQEFFPNDHLIRWLRVRRSPSLPAPLRLRLGPVDPPPPRGAQGHPR